MVRLVIIRTSINLGMEVLSYFLKRYVLNINVNKV